MKQKYLITIIIEMILIGLLSAYIIHIKRESIQYSLKNFFSKEYILRQGQLKNINQKATLNFIDTSNNKSENPFKILIVGNSISLNEIDKNIGWDYRNGMAATNIENDYAHLIFKKTDSLLVNRKLYLRISNLVEFERNFSNYDFSKIDSLTGFRPNLIIFQLGDNITFSDVNTPELFENKYTQLINYFKKSNNPIVICTTPFFPSFEKNEIIEKIALNTKSHLVDLSHLALLNVENLAKNELNYKNDKNVWKNYGIGIHPGDIGMRSIAEQLFITINASINKD